MFVQDWNCLHYGNSTKVICLYRYWNCLQYGNSTALHVCTGTGTVCSKATAQRHMIVQGLEMSAVR